jgi:hypothetical protein
MKKLLAALCVAALASCAAPESAPPVEAPIGQPAATAEATVQGIYDIAAQYVGRESTPRDAIPWSISLKTLLDRAEAATIARNEPFIDGDLATNCQDCTSLSVQSIAPLANPAALGITPVSGHSYIEAKFTVNGNEERYVIFDMLQTADGWRVDNLLTEGFNLRVETEAYIAEPTP